MNRQGPTEPSSTPPLCAIIFLLFVALSAALGRIPPAALGLYLVASAAAFLAYALDKSAALNDRWRTRERTLLLLGLVGGWPGALAAQGLLRHKTRKVSFQGLFWATVALNCCALAWLFSASGARMLRSLPGSTWGLPWP